MTDEPEQSNPDPTLGKARTPRALPGAGGASSPSEPNPPPAARPATPSLAEARALVSSPLWPAVRTFLWDFASLCDPARLAAALGGSEGAAPRSLDPRSSPRLARAAERALGLSPFFHPFPAADASRLLLLSREDYDHLALFLGTVALAPALRRVTLGADVRALKAALPDYRETLAFTAYFRKSEALFQRLAPSDTPATAESVAAAGHRLLAAALSDLPAPLLLRQRLRFPAGSPADAALGGANSPSDPQAAGSADHSAFSIQHSALAGDALAAAKLALKLSIPQEYTTCFS